MAHLRDAAAGDDDGHTHLRGLDHHLAGQTTRGVEHFVVGAHAATLLRTIGRAVAGLQRHPTGNRVDGVVATHVFHKHQQRIALEQCAAVHRTCRFIDAVVQADGVDDAVQSALRERGIGKRNGVDIGHQVTEHAALAATRGDHALGGFF